MLLDLHLRKWPLFFHEYAVLKDAQFLKVFGVGKHFRGLFKNLKIIIIISRPLQLLSYSELYYIPILNSTIKNLHILPQ